MIAQSCFEAMLWAKITLKCWFLFANNLFNCLLGRSIFIIKQHYLSMHDMKEVLFVMIWDAGKMVMRLI